ncbi:MAG: PD-(D/E)XK nuclease family protein [Cyanobacteria bacterium P01_A01_bin.123]
MLGKAQTILREIDDLLSENPLLLNDKDLIFMQCFNEAWFSNILSWLLNPKGSHKLGVSFSSQLLKTIAQVRTEGELEYTHKSSFLKWGKGGKGVSATQLSLKNTAIIREFYLAKPIRRRAIKGPRYCDIVLLDLDAEDSIFLAIENKLFTSNHPKQLEEYYELIEKGFKRVKIREYVYLTVYGIAPIYYGDASKKTYSYWTRLSWTKHILDIVNTLYCQSEHKEITRLRCLLEWIKTFGKPSTGPLIERLREVLVYAAASCLHGELIRLGEGKSGTWEMTNADGKSISLTHTSHPKTPLFVELLPTLSITVQSRRNKRPLFEKIIVPYGANIDQIFNLLDLTARDVYHYHFSKTDRYLGNKRRLTSTLTSIKKEMRPIFAYVSKHQYELKILLAASKHVWQAQKFELEELEQEETEV